MAGSIGGLAAAGPLFFDAPLRCIGAGGLLEAGIFDHEPMRANSNNKHESTKKTKALRKSRQLRN
jgi:hypothetical protein